MGLYRNREAIMESIRDNSLFVNVEGKRRENLTTEALRYILISEEYSNCQKFIYNMICSSDKNSDIKDSDTKDLLFDVKTQSYLGESQPDCLIKNKNTIIVIENKFFAPFTKNDQIHRYYSELQKLNPGIKKYLVLLTLKGMKKYYEKKIINQFRQPGEQLAKNIDQIFKDPNIKYTTILWDDIFDKFTEGDVVTRNLKSFIIKKFLISTIIDEEGLEMIKSENVPLHLTRLSNGVDGINNELKSSGITNPSKLNSGKDFYGFMIKESFGDIWFGYSVLAWLEIKTPYALQIRKGWRGWVEEFDEKKILEAGFRKSIELGYILPVEIDDNDIVKSSVDKISNSIIKLRQAMV